MMKNIKEIMITAEKTGFKPGDRVLPWVARCWLWAEFSGLRFAYGESEASAREALAAILAEEGVSV